MTTRTVIGIVGDRDPGNRTHLATEAALGHLAEPAAFEWVPTEDVGADPGSRLAGFQGLIIAPGSPYRSMEGALAAIRHARERKVPVLGTCGGFQHMVVEFARNVLGIVDADHAETNPAAPRLAVTPLTCSLAGQSHPVRVVPGTFAAGLYRCETTVEPFYCNYGLNPDFRPQLEARGLVVSGFGEDGRERIIELRGHPFFLGTLYVPQARSRPGEPHPLVAGLVAAARG
ncbi:MAG: gamma-glutamyl-gamma-aminobutyrate hydrolase family protein [Holophaga sp.]|jgi:CTP synthase (UTP-ammonia lyase)